MQVVVKKLIKHKNILKNLKSRKFAFFSKIMLIPTTKIKFNNFGKYVPIFVQRILKKASIYISRKHFLVFIAIIFILAGVTYLLIPYVPSILPYNQINIDELNYPIPENIRKILSDIFTTNTIDVNNDKKNTTNTENTSVNNTNTNTNTNTNNHVISENRLIIPKIGVNTRILESDTIDILFQKEGVWREPNSGIPGEKSSTVVIGGHRFQYLPPNQTTFYHLDKLNIGDKILIIWDGKYYVYKIFDKIIVDPHFTTVRRIFNDKNILVLYTCHPIGSDAQRIVVRAEMVISN
ncbi:MAG: class E sortase [Candidatus Dojkabacteria bacterium]|nr:class E sortase [Candidatus Dojkabacteria bacterium]